MATSIATQWDEEHPTKPETLYETSVAMVRRERLRGRILAAVSAAVDELDGDEVVRLLASAEGRAER